MYYKITLYTILYFKVRQNYFFELRDEGTIENKLNIAEDIRGEIYN